MSSTEPPGAPDDWDPDDTGAVPLGPEPEPTGAGGAGSGGWGAAPRTEPFAVAALVWAIVSVVLPIVGTIIALVLAARAADAIRRSRGTRSGTGLVTAARVIAGVVLVLWAIGLITYFALRDGDSDSNDLTVPTRPPSTTTSLAPSTTTTTLPPLTTTTAPPVITTPVAPTTSIVPPPPTQPTTPPTQPTTPPTEPTAPPTQPTEPPPTTTEPPPTTTEPPPTTTPIQGEERRLERLLLREGDEPNRIGPSNRGVPKELRVVVTYTPGQTLLVTWAIDNGAPPLPEGDATCTSPPPPPTTTSSTTTTTPEPDGSTTTTTTSSPDQLATAEVARREARNILNVVRADIENNRLDISGVQLVGTYPIEGATEGETVVVQSFYTNDDVIDAWPYQQAFQVPPAADVQCLNPAFD